MIVTKLYLCIKILSHIIDCPKIHIYVDGNFLFHVKCRVVDECSVRVSLDVKVRVGSILTWHRGHHDHEGGSPKVRLTIALRWC